MRVLELLQGFRGKAKELYLGTSILPVEAYLITMDEATFNSDLDKIEAEIHQLIAQRKVI